MKTTNLRSCNENETVFKFVFGLNGESIIYDSKLHEIFVEDIDGTKIVFDTDDLPYLQEGIKRIQAMINGDNDDYPI